jgi:saccharopine dehydrogenase-like NADP-dependent oxidoreductase
LHTVLILGGYGNFGTVISRALARDEGVRLLIAGRDATKARRLVLELGLNEQQGIALDADVTSLVKQLAALQVDILIHVAGPFQDKDYRVAQACIAAGCHYLDLADGRDFVANIGKLDAAAREAGVLVVSGASSVPALSSVVVDHFLPQFSRLDTISHGIVSGGKTPGLATVRAVLGYCGKSFTRLEGGYWKGVFGWQGLLRRRYPEPIGRRWLGNCDVPDLVLFPQRYPGVKTVTFHAGLGIPLAHLAVWASSWLVRWQLLGNMAQFAKPLHWLSRLLELFGPQESAMHVELSGADHQGKPLTRTWHIVARQHHGPCLPCGAAIALVRKLVQGSLRERGAMPCVGLLTLDEYMDALPGLDTRQIYG